MTPSYEVLLIIGIVGFYLTDTLVLLYHNEAIFSLQSGRWSSSFPSEQWQLKNKLLHMGNLFTPHACQYRVAWCVSDRLIASSQGNIDPNDQAMLLQPIGIGVMMLFFYMLVLMPMVLVFLGTGKVFLILIAAIYVTIIFILVLIYRMRAQLNLSTKMVRSLVFECLACPPHAINLVRRITLTKDLQVNPVAFARTHFSDADFDKLVAHIRKDTLESIELTDDPARQQSLQGYLKYLTDTGK